MKASLHLVLVAFSLDLLAAGVSVAEESLYDSPQNVFRAAQLASEEGKPLDVMRCTTADSLEALAVLAAEALIDLDQHAEQYPRLTLRPRKLAQSRKKLAKLLNDYGLSREVIADIHEQHKSREARLTQISAKITDKPGLMIALAEHGHYEADPKTLKLRVTGELVAVEIMGDNAVGRVIETLAEGPSVEKQFEFRRTGRGWRIFLPCPLDSLK